MSERDQHWKDTYGRQFLGYTADGTPYYQELTDEQAEAKYLKMQGVLGFATAAVGGGGALISEAMRDQYKHSGELDRYMSAGSLDSNLDPDLKGAWLQADSPFNGRLNTAAAKAIAQNIPQDAEDWVKADLSNAGGYRKALDAYNRSKYARDLWSIGTVTPRPESTRFGASNNSDQPTRNRRTGRGGSSPEAAMLWGNAGENQYVYAGQDSSNPAVHYSGADLPPDEEGRYLFTGEANKEAEVGKRTTWGRKSKAPNADMMFGSETRRLGGITTMADVFTELANRGQQPPPKGTMNSVDYFQQLGEQLADLEGTTPYKALESLASPHPVSGVPGRETGTVPETLEYRFADATPEQLERVGLGPNGIFEENINPMDRDYVPVLDAEVKSDKFIQLKKVRPTAIRQSFARPVGGIVGTATQSEDIAKDIRNGDYGQAALRTAASYGGGELVGNGVNAGLSALAKRGITLPAQIAGTAGQAAALPLAAVGTMDAATALATGKNSREILVESGNTGPAIAAMTAPMTMAPLGLAGGPSHMQGAQGNQLTAEQTRANQAALDERARLARERGPNALLPELGISEWMGINGQELAPQPYPRNTPPKTKEQKQALQEGPAEVKRLEANAEAAKKRGGRWRFAGVAMPEFGLSEIFGLN